MKIVALIAFFASIQCQHYADALVYYGDAAFEGDGNAQRAIMLHQMACQAVSEDEFGAGMEIKHCVYHQNGAKSCQFEVMESE